MLSVDSVTVHSIMELQLQHFSMTFHLLMLGGFSLALQICSEGNELDKKCPILKYCHCQAINQDSLEHFHANKVTIFICFYFILCYLYN